MFHAVAGRPPFEAESASLVALKHLKSKAVSLQAFAPDVSGETAYVINRMLHKDPGQRYASYGELLDHFKYAIDTLTANAAKPRAAKPRVVVESENQSNVAGILTLVLLVLLIAGGITAYYFRDRFGAGSANANPAAVNPKALAGGDKADAEAAYEDARHDIVAGRYGDAKESFAALLQRTDLVQPTLNWVKLHNGLTALLNNEATEARAIFSELQKDGLYTKDGTQLKLANFFVETGRLVAEPKPVPAGVLKNWDKDTVENMALLLFGLKDWSMGNFDDANAIFEAYLAGKPPAPYGWIGDYEPIARRCVHDYAIYAPLSDKRKDPGVDPKELRTEFTKARNQLQTSGKMVEAFFAAESELDKDDVPGKSTVPDALPTEGKVATSATAVPSPPEASATTPNPVASPTPAPPVNSAAHDAERIRWQTTRESYRQQVALYHFEQAQAVLAQASLTEPDFVTARGIALARAKNMVAFKGMLIGDINRHNGYPKPVNSRRGINYPRGIQKAASETVEAGTPYGTITVPWTDFAPQALLAIAAYYTDSTTQPAIAAERRWWAANFALESGQPGEAKALAARAAQDQPGYQKDLGQFSGAIGTTVALPPTHSAP